MIVHMSFDTYSIPPMFHEYGYGCGACYCIFLLYYCNQFNNGETEVLTSPIKNGLPAVLKKSGKIRHYGFLTYATPF